MIPHFVSVLGFFAAVLPVGVALASTPEAPEAATAGPTLSSVAIRVHRIDAMEAFYRDAFGFRFRDVETQGLASRFGERGSLTLKLVPIREEVDFESFPVHQLGFTVSDVDAVIELAERHGGKKLRRERDESGHLHAAVRDPDGNSIELYSAPP